MSAISGNSENNIPMVTLKDGQQVPQPVLVTTMMNLQMVAERDFFALYDLSEKCKDHNYEIIPTPFGDSKKTLSGLNLMDTSGRVHDYTKAIVKNAVEGADFNIRLVNPRKIV